MAQTRVPKSQLGPLGLIDEDVTGFSLSVLTQSGAEDNQVPQWDGTNWVPVSIASGSIFVDDEVPAGDINGVNREFTLASQPAPLSSIQLFKGGILQRQGEANDYTVNNNIITFNVAPEVNDTLVVYYRR